VIAPPIPPRDVAVVDVGSNSVRLVLYRVEGRAIWTVHNEKVLAGLGRGLDTSGRLNPEGAEAALAALRRFRAVLDGAQPSAIHTAATAAVREAADGPAFVQRVREEAGLELRVLTGEEEAHWGAMGVIAGMPNAVGVAGDLGGSSLELTRIGDGQVSPGVSLPLGPFAMGAPKDYDAARGRKAALQGLDAVAESFRASEFHAVGGAWRNLALLQMRMTGYPLHVVHQYRLHATEALDMARLIARQSRSSLERMPGVSKKRLETLPHAAVLLEAVIERLGCERVVFSAYGVREGMIYDAMPPELRACDPLVAGCAALGARLGVAEGLGQALEAWLAPALAALPPAFREERAFILLAAAARLADIGARLHPDHRGALAFDQVCGRPSRARRTESAPFWRRRCSTATGADETMPEAATVARVPVAGTPGQGAGHGPGSEARAATFPDEARPCSPAPSCASKAATWCSPPSRTPRTCCWASRPASG
jgi:exopolyphosphatase/guanosine-5'-triphosphate,3'-diphosphate pyrophosphatase